MNVIHRKSRAQYPYVVEPLLDGWVVLFVRSARPSRVAEFDKREDAFRHIRHLNRQWWLETHALDQARSVIAAAQETSALHHASASRASLWTRVKTALRLR